MTLEKLTDPITAILGAVFVFIGSVNIWWYTKTAWNFELYSLVAGAVLGGFGIGLILWTVVDYISKKCESEQK